MFYSILIKFVTSYIIIVYFIYPYIFLYTIYILCYIFIIHSPYIKEYEVLLQPFVGSQQLLGRLK